jgi:hypothetical protein
MRRRGKREKRGKMEKREKIKKEPDGELNYQLWVFDYYKFYG